MEHRVRAAFLPLPMQRIAYTKRILISYSFFYIDEVISLALDPQAVHKSIKLVQRPLRDLYSSMTSKVSVVPEFLHLANKLNNDAYTFKLTITLVSL